MNCFEFKCCRNCGEVPTVRGRLVISMSGLKLITRLGMVLATAAAACGALAKPVKGVTSPDQTGLSCDQSIVEKFKPDPRATVIQVKQFRKGDQLSAEFEWYLANSGISKTVEADLCLVKLLVGPGNPGPADSASTSAGIGIEIWLPEKSAWNGRLHAVGTGGWAGGVESDPAKNSTSFSNDLQLTSAVAAREGAVVSSTDAGHMSSATDGSFAMNPDGTSNTVLWRDYASRSLHVQAVMTTALATAYYGRKPKYRYFEGGSGGGRQALALAQRYPRDYDGIIAAFPAVYFSKFILASLYPQIVIQRDLGGRYMSNEQLDFVSNQAIAACDVLDGKHLGFVIDQKSCRYDPARDPAVLCASSGGNNVTPNCVTPQQANAINKIWYGMTSDGSVPSPAFDNGFGPLTGKRRWFGYARGTSLLVTASNQAFVMAADMAGLALQDPAFASSTFRNARTNGMDRWKSLTYEQLSEAFDLTEKRQSSWDYIDSQIPDLSAFKKRGGKLIHYHGTDDPFIPFLGSEKYYDSVIAQMHGLKNVQNFYRFYLVPGMWHGPRNGTSNPNANPPIIRAGKGEVYDLLTAWVEKGAAPVSIVLQSESDVPVQKTLPMCLYPSRVSYVSGDINSAESYTCK
ncbi:tannase/feruloyl esterase family alpha/beta hydrolase [Aquisediminimonas profunda]|uniref:tannase/feruloyl esterase family alpha/beta hydrolase n=1 Tax=Aquisediminimonas profunda TaxID=1550733 RepID=UPI001C635B6A|nr:tannase/feruloyl esterase family alpha/beta hydrolase [Aquisediminimonas profunda]